MKPKAKNVKSEFWFGKLSFRFRPFCWRFGKRDPFLNTISRFVHVYRNWSFGPFHLSWRDEVVLEIQPVSEQKRKWFLQWMEQKKSGVKTTEKPEVVEPSIFNYAKRV